MIGGVKDARHMHMNVSKCRCPCRDLDAVSRRAQHRVLSSTSCSKEARKELSHKSEQSVFGKCPAFADGHWCRASACFCAPLSNVTQATSYTGNAMGKIELPSVIECRCHGARARRFSRCRGRLEVGLLIVKSLIAAHPNFLFLLLQNLP